MKTKLYSIVAGLFLSTTSAMACDDSSHVVNINLSGRYHYWSGFDFGVNGYLNRSNTIETPSGYDFLELDYARSHSFAWNIAQYNLHIYKNHVNLYTGIGLEWNSYSLRNN